jgi:hypothetical protein
MKKTLINILKIIVLSILIDVFLGMYFNSLYEKNYCQHACGDLNYYLKHGDSDTIIIGSSRVNTMINNKLINKNSVNLSKPGKHILYNTAVISLLKQFNKFPKDLIILNLELDDFILENEKKNLADVYYLKYYYHKNEYIRKKINENSIYEPIKFLSQSYRFNGDNFKLFSNQFQNICDSKINGYYPLDYTIPKEKFITEKRSESYAKSNRFNNKIFNELTLINQICISKKTKFYILLGPTINKTGGLKQSVFRELKKFCSKNKIEFLNLYQSNTFNDFSYWADLIHLNKKGSIIYTKMIIDQLNQLKKIDN